MAMVQGLEAMEGMDLAIYHQATDLYLLPLAVLMIMKDIFRPGPTQSSLSQM